MPVLHYIYDALCGWCFGFSPVVQQLYDKHKDKIEFDVLSGGMIPPEFAQPFAAKAGFIASAYKEVEEFTGREFGEKYLDYVFHPEKCPWKEESLTPAIALCLLKAAQPIPYDNVQGGAVYFAGEIQKLHMVGGKDLSDPESYRQLALEAGCDWNDFLAKMQSEEWIEAARYEFSLVRQLGISSFPAVVMQVSEDRFFLIGKGYTAFEELERRFLNVLEEANMV
jgi:putative protein-disulfide isomerase